MKTLEEFRSFYASELQGDLEGFEDRRKGILRNLILALVGTVVVAGGAALLLGGRYGPPAYIIPAGIGIVAFFITAYFLTRGYKREFKISIVGKIMSFVDPSLVYSPEAEIGRDRFVGSLLYTNRPDRYSGEDHVAGQIGDTRIEFSEVHAQEKVETRDSKGRRQTSYRTIFKGVFFIADFNKEFQGATMVLPDLAEKALGWLGQKLQSLNFVRKGELVKLEDPEFEKLFAVYSTDQIEARYILSPALMERLKEFREKSKRDVRFSFVHSNVHVAISTSKDMFEPRIVRSVLNPELCEDYFSDLVFVLGIVDELNLNRRIWSKQPD